MSDPFSIIQGVNFSKPLASSFEGSYEQFVAEKYTTIDLGALQGFFLNGDYEGSVWLQCCLCGWSSELVRGQISVTHISPNGYDFGTWVLTAVYEVLKHDCPRKPQN